jgi:hypothetical protein
MILVLCIAGGAAATLLTRLILSDVDTERKEIEWAASLADY